MIKFTLSLALILPIFAVQINQFAQHFTNENGLNHNQVNVLSINPEQKLWVGGKRGLSIFNGSTWQTIQLPENFGSHYISQNTIAHFKESTLIGTENGLAIYYRGNWQSLHTIKKQRIERINKIICSDKAVWLWFESSIAVSEDLSDWKIYNLNSQISDIFINNNQAYAVHNNALLQLQTDGTKTPLFTLDQSITSVTRKTGIQMFAVSDSRKILRLDLEQKSTLTLAVLQTDITALAYDSLLNRLWIGTSAGLYFCENQSVHKYQQTDLNTRYITTLVISTQIRGFQTNSILWVGSYNGLYQVINPATITIQFPATISSISENNTHFLVGSDDGMFRVEKQNLQISPFLPELFNSKRIEAQLKTLNTHFIASVDELFILQNEQLIVRAKTVNNLALTRIFKFIQTKVGTLIFTKNGHVFAYQNNTLSLVHQSENKDELIDAAVNSNTQQLWLLTEKSLESLDLTTKKITQNLNSLLPTQPTALVVDASKIIIGSENNLVQIVQDESENILASTAIEGLSQANSTTLFVRSDRKILGLQLDSTANKFQTFFIANAEDGVSALRSPRFFMSQSKNVLLSSNANELQIRQLPNLQKSVELPHLIIQSNQVEAGEAISPQSIQFEYRLPLLYQASIINYTVLLNGETLKLADPSRHILSFPNLSPNKYTIEVQAESPFSNTVAKSQFRFEILAPWYASTIAFLIYGLILIGLAFWLVRLRLAALSNRNIQLEKIVEERLVEIKAQKESLEIKNRRLDQNADQLRKANNLKNEFLGMAAHDLKNPLSVISGFTSILIDEGGQSDEHKEYLEIIERSSTQMFSLISELLESAKLDETELKLNKEEADLEAILQPLLNSYKHAVQTKNITISHTTNDKIIAHVDIDRIREVFDNLVSNAIKYSPQDKNVWIFLNRDNSRNMIRFTVKDEGQGMTEDDLANAFGRFKRLSAQPTGGESSSGLGLSIVKKLVELHEGRVWIESEYGHGCMFIVELPIQADISTKSITDKNS